MNKTSIKKELLAFTEGRPFISQIELKKCLKLGSDSVRRLVYGMDYIKNGNRKDYLIEDISQMLADKSHQY